MLRLSIFASQKLIEPKKNSNGISSPAQRSDNNYHQRKFLFFKKMYSLCSLPKSDVTFSVNIILQEFPCKGDFNYRLYCFKRRKESLSSQNREREGDRNKMEVKKKRAHTQHTRDTKMSKR